MSSNTDTDSDAPDDVSFSTGKADAIRDLTIAKVERNKQDNCLKEWRRRRDALYKQQKEKKQLSLDVLTKADAKIKKRRLEEDSPPFEEDNSRDDASDTESLDVSATDDEKELVDEEDMEETVNESVTDKYEEELRIAVIDAKGSSSLMQAALEFKSRSLYGDRIRRIDMSQVRSRRRKQKVTNKVREESIKARRLNGAR